MMSYLNTLTAAELQELVDISSSHRFHKSDLLQSLNQVLHLKEQGQHQNLQNGSRQKSDPELEPELEVDSEHQSSGILESLIQPISVNVNNEGNDSNDVHHTPSTNGTTATHTVKGEKSKKNRIIHRKRKSKVCKEKKLYKLARSTASSREKRKQSITNKLRSETQMKRTKSSKRLIHKPMGQRTGSCPTAPHPVAEYQNEPKDFYLQNLVKQNISDSVTIQQLRNQLQESKTKLDITISSHHQQLKQCKTIELKLEQQIETLSADSNRFKLLRKEHQQLQAKCQRLQSVVDKVMKSSTAQKEDYQLKLKTLQQQNEQLQHDMDAQQQKHEQQLDLYHRAQLVTDSKGQKISKQAEAKTSKLKVMRRQNQQLIRKCEALSVGLETANKKYNDAQRKQKATVHRLVSEKREAMLQFQGALRKMEYMVLEKQDIAQQFHLKTQQIQKMQQRLLSQEKMVRSLRTNMQSLAHNQTKDAMQSRIQMLVSLCSQWDDIQVTDVATKDNAITAKLHAQSTTE